MSLIQLIYASQLGEDAEADAELPQILEQSIRNNCTAGITGMLLFSSGSFLQVLEGESDMVGTIYRKICADARHTNVVIVGLVNIEERQFPNWSMGLRQLKLNDRARFPEFAPLFQFGFGDALLEAGPGVARDLLATFSRE